MPVCLPACQPVYLYACMYIWWGLHTNKDFWSLRSSRPSPAESGGLYCSYRVTSGTHGVSRNGKVTECPSSGLYSASGKTRCQKPNLRDQFSLITSLSKPPNHLSIRNTWVLAEAIQIQARHSPPCPPQGQDIYFHPQHQSPLISAWTQICTVCSESRKAHSSSGPVKATEGIQV